VECRSSAVASVQAAIYRFSTLCFLFYLFFFNAPAPTQIYTLSLHDALPISVRRGQDRRPGVEARPGRLCLHYVQPLPGCRHRRRSEEHTSELQSQSNLVCRLLLEKKKKKKI